MILNIVLSFKLFESLKLNCKLIAATVLTLAIIATAVSTWTKFFFIRHTLDIVIKFNKFNGIIYPLNQTLSKITSV